MHLFISYASENREIAELITFAMRARGYEVFLDKDDLPAGDSYEDKIEKAIKSSDLFIFLISKGSVKSGRYTLTEIRLARKKWKNPKNRILPVMIEPVEIKQIPAYIKSVSILQPEGDAPAEVCAEAAQVLKAQQNETSRPVLASNLPHASFLRRCLSSLIDSIFLFLFLVGIFHGLLIEVPSTHGSIGLTIFLRIVSFLAIIGFYTVSLLNLHGTPGDRFFGLRVVDETTRRPLSVSQALTWTGCYIPLWFMSWIWYFYDDKKRMLHNIVSKTIVVSERDDDQIEQLTLKTYNVLKDKFQQKDFQSDLQYFQNVLDQMKPDRKTRAIQRNGSAGNVSANPYGWALKGIAKNGAPLLFQIKSAKASKAIWIIGRQNGDCDFQINQSNVSRKHAEIRLVGSNGLSVRDLSSTNGTYLNGRKLSTAWSHLNEGDRISIGSAKLKLVRI